MAIATGHPEIIDIETGQYTIEFKAVGYAKWLTCYKEGGTGEAIYDDITEAEERLNALRDDNPHGEFRMLRKVTFTEVVYA